MNVANTLSRAAIAAVAAIVVSQPLALADPPPWAGGGKGHQQRGEEHRGKARGAEHEHREHRFGEHDRVVIADYYGHEMRSGRCPPGLAKKHNGCMPPGQARKWRLGQPLPREVVYYPLPPALVVELGVPPAGYKYVRVASDILLIAVGSSMVMDAIQDIGRM